MEVPSHISVNLVEIGLLGTSRKIKWSIRAQHKGAETKTARMIWQRCIKLVYAKCWLYDISVVLLSCNSLCNLKQHLLQVSGPLLQANSWACATRPREVLVYVLSVVTFTEVKAGTHSPWTRPVNTGVNFWHPCSRPCSQWYFWRPCDIFEAREHGPCCLKTAVWRQYDVLPLGLVLGG